MARGIAKPHGAQRGTANLTRALQSEAGRRGTSALAGWSPDAKLSAFITQGQGLKIVEVA